MSLENSKLYQTFALTPDFNLKNRVVMAPMTTWSGNSDGTVSEQELQYMRRRVKGVGMVITGCTHVQENGIGFTHEFAGYDDKFIPSLSALAQAAKSGGAPAILQIFHAGNKAIAELIPNGDVVSASHLNTPTAAFHDSSVQSRALSEAEITEVIRAFGETTLRAIEAGFDGVELHGAHGFLIQNFFSPHYNQRQDDWGGSLAHRMRFPLAVVEEVKSVIHKHAKRPFIFGYRISVEEYEENGLRIADSLQLIDQLIESNIDYLHVSLSDILSSTPRGVSDQRLTIQTVLDHVQERVPVISAGSIRTPEQASLALNLGLPLVAIGKGLIINPEWVELAQAGQVGNIASELNPEWVTALDIPNQLWEQIDSNRNWFPVCQTQAA